MFAYTCIYRCLTIYAGFTVNYNGCCKMLIEFIHNSIMNSYLYYMTPFVLPLVNMKHNTYLVYFIYIMGLMVMCFNALVGLCETAVIKAEYNIVHFAKITTHCCILLPPTDFYCAKLMVIVLLINWVEIRHCL